MREPNSAAYALDLLEYVQYGGAMTNAIDGRESVRNCNHNRSIELRLI